MKTSATMQTSFKPVIYEDSDGTQTFLNTVIDIEFRFSGAATIRRFEFDDGCAPRIPFCHIGEIVYEKKLRLFVVDPTGTAWAEQHGGEMKIVPIDMLLMVLMGTDHPDLAAVFSIVNGFLVEDDAIDAEQHLD
jgi:hypothetical protein